MEHPRLQQVNRIDLVSPSEELSVEGIRYVYKADTDLDIIKIDIVFKAGRKYEEKPMVSKLTANMLRLGTQTLSAEAFAEEFEFYGTELKLREGFNFITLSVSFVKRHFDAITDLLIQCVTAPLFAEDEFEKLKRRLIQQLKLSLKKSDVVAFRLFTEAIFGPDHSYGYNSTAEAIQQVHISDLQQHFKRGYSAENCSVFLYGGLDDEKLRSFKDKMRVLNKSVQTRAKQESVLADVNRTKFIRKKYRLRIFNHRFVSELVCSKGRIQTGMTFIC